MADIKSARRFYLLARLRSNQTQDGLADIWRGRQEAQASTDLPGTFPLRARLATVGYSTVADLDGADSAELIGAGFAAHEAEAVMRAFANL